MEELTPAQIRTWRQERGITQEKLGEQLGLKKVAITKIESGQRQISQPEQKLLQLLIYGRLPFITPEIEAKHSQLDFTADQWRVIQKAARSEGYPNTRDWIVDKIKSYLRMNPQTAKDQLAAENAAAYNPQGR